MHRHRLATNSRRSREKTSLVLAEFLVQYFLHALVVQQRIVIVHEAGVTVIVVRDILKGNAFAKVRLECRNAHVHQLLEVGLIPLPRLRVCEVYQSHASLPVVHLEDTPICALDEISAFATFLEQRTLLCNVRIDPHTDALALFLLQACEVALRIWEHVAVELETAPLEAAHPEAVEVEDGEWDVSFLETIDETCDGALVVRGCERCRQPQAVGPRW